MQTQKYRGRNVLVKRLAAQVGGTTLAESILKKRGHLRANGSLTAAGKKRDNMTARDRALDRAVKASGGRKTDYTYDPKTNRTKKKK